MLDWDDPVTWDDAYKSRYPIPGQYEPLVLRYHRHALWPTLKRNASALVRLLELGASSNIILVGAGYGWTAEIIKGLVPGIAINCTDNSKVIQAKKFTSEQEEIEERLRACGADLSHLPNFCNLRPRAQELIYDENMVTPASRAIMRQGRNFDWIISENVLDCMEDGEAITLAGHMASTVMGGKVAHVITQPREGREPPDGYNFKSAEDWKKLLPEHHFISAGAWVMT